MIFSVLPFVLSGQVCGKCMEHQQCDDPVEILGAIKAHPDNYQQILNAFYPVNWAQPSSVIIVYFVNYTNQLPEECSAGIYPWKTYPVVNSTYYSLWWYMWTTTPIYSVGTDIVFIEFGEYLPTMSYYFLLNKTSPFYLPTRIACIKLPVIPKHAAIAGDITTQVSEMRYLIKFSL